MCFVWISEQTAIISLYNINWLVCITQKQCVYSAVRTGPLYIIQGSGGWSSASRWRSPGLTQLSTCGICGWHWAQKQVIVTVFMFPLSVSCQQCSILIFTYTMLLLSCRFYGFTLNIQIVVVAESGVNWHYTVWSIVLRCRSTQPHAHCTRLELYNPVYSLSYPSGPNK